MAKTKLRVVDKNAKAADAKPKKGAAAKGDKKAKTAKAPKVRKFQGKTTGLNVRDFQNQLMAKNFKARLTDEQLAKAMREEFPGAVPYTVEHVVGIRSAWNKGKHGNEAPDRPLPAFDADGKPLPMRGEKTAAKKAAKATADKKGAKKSKAKAEPEEDDEDEVEEEDEEEEEEDE